MTEFEWDPQKSAVNKRKHGLAFHDAVQIWHGPHFTVEDVAQTRDGEKRSATMGMVRGELFMAIWTRRAHRIRLISVRRARDGEKKAFYKNL